MSELTVGDRRALRAFLADWLHEEDFRRFTSWEDAGLLLDNMAAKGLKPHLMRAMHGKWMCKVNDQYADRCVSQASDDTGPLAIAKAVLKIAPVTQLEEPLNSNEGVAGSSPAGGASEC